MVGHGYGRVIDCWWSAVAANCRVVRATLRIVSVMLVVGVGLIAALIVRFGWKQPIWRDLVLVGVAGMGLRLVAVGVIAFIAITADSNSTGVWLNDEAS